jgi:endonuclease G
VITKEKSLAKLPRKNSFIADPDLPTTHRAYPSDYEKSGYDKGHLTAFKDVGVDSVAAKETFYMSNMIPQSPGNNQNGWRLLEEYVRELSMSKGDLYVITGPVYLSPLYQTIGKSKVAVPDAIYKIVISKTEKFILVIMVPNSPLTKQDLNKYITELRNVEDATGIRFFPLLPVGYEVKTKI